MNRTPRFTLPACAIAVLGLITAPIQATADEVPDGLSVEWQGKKPCEKLFEDAHVRVARCTFPPGAMHLCHSHPSYMYYVLNGGKARVQDTKGVRTVDLATGAFTESPPIEWHEVSNVGDTTLQFLVVEKKYETAPPVSRMVCPERTPQ
jgi:beta-alanine degradation protein BauB